MIPFIPIIGILLAIGGIGAVMVLTVLVWWHELSDADLQNSHDLESCVSRWPL